jgi:hypothetical protein
MNTIFYNNKDAFENISYTPFVSYQMESDGYISSKEIFVLNGEIIADCPSAASGIFAKQKMLINNFSKNYANFQIKEENNSLYSCDNAAIKSIDFEDSDYAFIVPFSIEIECYEKNFFSGQYGVYDMENIFDIQEGADQSASIAHTISAKGFNNNNSAIYNATNWVYANSGIDNMPQAQFVKLNNGNAPFLVSLQEEIDRFNGSCSIKEIYSFDQAELGNGLLKYRLEIKTDKLNFNTASLVGSIDMGRYGSMSTARQRYASLDFYSIAAHLYRKATDLNDLSAIVVDHSIDEDLTKNTLNFKITYNNDNSPLVKIETRAKLDIGNDLTNTRSVASINSRITSRNGIKTKRFQDALSYFSTSFNPLSEFQKNIHGINYNLAHMRHESDSVTVNEKNAFIEYNCTWTIMPINMNLPCYIKGGQLKMTLTPQINEYNFVPVLCSNWAAFFKGFKWSSKSLDGQLSVYSGNESAAILWARNLAGGFGVQRVATESSSSGSVSFQYRYELIY